MFSTKSKVTINDEDAKFEVRYIGKVETFVPHGTGCTKVPAQKIWDASCEEKNMTKISLVIAPTGITIKNIETKQQIRYDIENISFCNAEKEVNDRIFCWICKVPDSGKLYCHAVLCSSKEKAQALALVMNRAFHIAYKDWKATRERSARQRTSSKEHEKVRKELGKMAKSPSLEKTSSASSSTSNMEKELNDEVARLKIKQNHAEHNQKIKHNHNSAQSTTNGSG